MDVTITPNVFCHIHIKTGRIYKSKSEYFDKTSRFLTQDKCQVWGKMLNKSLPNITTEILPNIASEKEKERKEVRVKVDFPQLQRKKRRKRKKEKGEGGKNK